MNAIDDATLLKMAESEILGEAKRAATRHSLAGISGWQPCPKPNKMFLTNMLLQTMASNKHLVRKKGKHQKSKNSERKLLQSKNKTDMTNNFMYQKPKNEKKKLVNSQNSKYSSSNIKPVDVNAKSKNEFKEKFNAKTIKLEVCKTKKKKQKKKAENSK